MKPKISIIIAAYIDSNEKLGWLSEALHSIKGQSFTDWEAIIIDDHSPLLLDTIKIEYGGEKFRWVKTTKQSGPSLSRNTGVVLGEADALIVLDADDMFHNSHTLENMYNVWNSDKTKVVYGDLQRYEIVGDTFKATRELQLPEYSFDNVLDLNGIIPVRALHSRQCWEKAGGWKSQLEFGLEDVEYWIAAGKAGFCGVRIPQTTLLYRKHNNSRSYRLRRVNRQEINTRNKIKQMHEDVYRGEKPMGCCGKGNSSNGYAQQGATPSGNSPAPASLSQFKTEDLVWVEYTGNRSAVFGVVGQSTQYTYKIHGRGYKLPIHKDDVQRFRNSGRGRDFSVMIGAPDGANIPEEMVTSEYVAPQPELAEIFGLDRKAVESPNVTSSSNVSPTAVASPQSQLQAADALLNSASSEPTTPAEGALSPLGLNNKVREMLESEGWTIETLAEASQLDLVLYPGIGPIKADTILQRAKEYASVSVQV